jgi:hypothetical protein
MRRGDIGVEVANQLDAEVFGAYVEGLRRSGWRGPEHEVRLGFCASVALRWHLVDGTLQALTDPTASATRHRAGDATRKEGVEQLVLLTRFLLERADEARSLSARSGD